MSVTYPTSFVPAFFLTLSSLSSRTMEVLILPAAMMLGIIRLYSSMLILATGRYISNDSVGNRTKDVHT